MLQLYLLSSSQKGRGFGRNGLGYRRSSANFALQFDGTQNYVDFGTMGTFGSSLTNGAYVSFTIKTTDTGSNKRVFSVLTGSNKMAIQAFINNTQSGSIKFIIADDNAHTLNKEALSANINDGNVHAVVITADVVAMTAVITVDGISQSLNDSNVGTLGTFVDFNQHLVMGTLNNNGTINNTVALAGTIDNFKIGTSSTTLFGSYGFNEGTGITTADVSGKGNTGTLTGSPTPSWVSGI